MRIDAGMEQMTDMFIFETTSLLEQLEQILMKTESENSFGEEDINEIFRIMHTIKGSSAMMGLENMSHLAHSVEDLFYIIREDRNVVKDAAKLYDLVFTASDLLRAEIDLINDDAPPTDFSEVMEKIRAYAASLKKGGDTGTPAVSTAAPAASDSEPAPVTALPGMTTLRIRFEEGTAMIGLRASVLLNSVADRCISITTVPAEFDSDEAQKQLEADGLILSFAADDTDMVISILTDGTAVASCEELGDKPSSDKKARGEASKELTTVRVMFEPGCKMENLRALMVVNNIKDDCKEIYFSPENIEEDPSSANVIRTDGFIIRYRSDLPDEEILRQIGETPSVKSVDTITAAAESGAKKTETAAAGGNAPEKKARTEHRQSLVSVNLAKLDQLLNMMGEIVIAEAMVTSNPDLKGLKLDNFQKAARQLRKLNSEMQDIVMSIRMVPISGAFNKMTRIVRDMKVKLGKEAELVFEGEDTEVDKSVIDNLNDPLMHMVRNSMDHGIEDWQEERVKEGKPPVGRITLSASSSSGEVVISVSDDGKGMDPQKILAKAEANGILTKPRTEYTDKEAFGLIMLPGFSTNEQVTEYSGRGVGMDVVKQSIEKLGGTVSVDSKKGKGTTFTIKIPLSLSIVDGMEVAVGRSIFTIPINYIKESFKLREGQLITDTEGKEMIMIRGECFPLIRLSELYGLEGGSGDLADGIIILVEADGRSACLFADELIGEQQVVIKPFSQLLISCGVKQNGMAGCSILGDGSITIIMDISSILADN
ncbi:MAG: chemotaxis protein CheA [Oscillospiraceae bacterium]|nr:chemotaxis protein CheA [Oscillospiraceae bacterium]